MKKNLLKTKLVLLMALLCTGLSSAWADTSTGTVDFVGVERATISEGTFTTADNAGNKYALAIADLSGVENIAGATTITLEFDVQIQGRLVVGIGDKISRGTNAGGSSKSTYVADGLIMRYATTDGTYVRVNGGTNNSDALGALSHVKFTFDRIAKTYSYVITNGETTLFSASNVSTSINNATIIEVYSWVGSQTNTLSSNVSYSFDYSTETFSYSLSAVDSESTELATLASGTGVGTVNAYYPYAIKVNNDWYTCNTSSYGVELTSVNPTASVIYTKDETIIFYNEEAAAGTNETNSFGGSTYVASQNKRDRGLSLGTLSAGTYEFVVAMAAVDANAAKRALVVRQGVNDPIVSLTGSTTYEVKSATITLTEETQNLWINGANSGDEKTNQSATFDYVLIKKVGEYTPEPVDPQPVVVGFPGATDKSSPFSQSDNYQLQMGKKVTFTFKNYGYGTNPESVANSYYNWTIGVYTGEVCHAFTRADFWDNIMAATTGYEHAMSSDGGQTTTWLNWDSFKADMTAGADVNMVVTYNTDGTLTINAVSTGESGNLYYVNRTVEGMTANSVDLRLGIEYSYITDLTANFEDIPEEPVVIDEGDYEITISDAEEGGELLTNRTKANEDDDVTFTAKADQGYKLDKVLIQLTTAAEPDGASVELSRRGATAENPTLEIGDIVTIPASEFVDGKYTFKMYACDIFVKPVFVADQTPQPTTYSVTIIGTDVNGSVTANPTTAEAGETIVLTITPNQGYELDKLKINNVEVTVTGNTYTTTMPEGGLTVYPTFKLIEVPVQKAKLTLNTEWTTFYSPVTMELADGVEAYTVSDVIIPETEGLAGTVQLVKRNYIAKNVPMILHNTALATSGTKTFELVINEDAETGIAPNTLGAVFKGTSEDITVAKNDVYVLKNGKFVLYSGTSIKKYNCYIDFPYEPEVEARSLNFEVVGDQTTGIKALNRVAVEGQVYDLQGRQMDSAVKKGIYVIGGKKVVIK